MTLWRAVRRQERETHVHAWDGSTVVVLQAGQTAANVAGYTPGSFLTGNIGAYMNPYLQQVEQAIFRQVVAAIEMDG